MEKNTVGVVHTFASECRCHEYIIAGLKLLGHDYLEIDSEKVTLYLDDLARADFVFDHTDTYMGKGELRPFVRWHLESAGARTVGSDFRTCYFADNKISSKKILTKGAIPTPSYQVVSRPHNKGACSLNFPVVIKPAFQHLSRGLAVARDQAEYAQKLEELAATYLEPFLVEEYIPGREIAICLVGNNQPTCLPLTEISFTTDGAEPRVYSYQAKSVKESPAYQSRTLPRPAVVERKVLRKILALAWRAYRLFNIKDYCRFDVRLAEDLPYFLEVNTKPSFEPDSGLAVAARLHGWENHQLVDHLLKYAQNRYTGKPKHAREVSNRQRR